MELSMNIGYLKKRRGTNEKRSYKEIAKIVKTAGFKYVDFSDNYTGEDNWKELTLGIIEDVRSEGLIFDQSHAPFNYQDMPLEEFRKRVQRSFEIASMCGCEHIVIHADKYDPDENGFDTKKAVEEIYEFYAPLVEYAKKVNLGVAIENLFDWYPEGKRCRFTAYVEEQKAIIERFNDPIVTACWDFGHGKVSYPENYLDALKELGSLVTCTHVHDNIYDKDLHSNIFLGNTKWEEVIKYLKESNYGGKFTFEMVYGCIPDKFIQEYMNLFYKMGEYLVNL